MDRRIAIALSLLTVIAAISAAAVLSWDHPGEDADAAEIGDPSGGFDKDTWRYEDITKFDGYRIRIGFADVDKDDLPDEECVYVISIKDSSYIKRAEVIDLDILNENFYIHGLHWKINRFGDGVNPVQENLQYPPAVIKSTTIKAINDNAIYTPGVCTYLRDYTQFLMPHVRYVGANNFNGCVSDISRHDFSDLDTAGRNAFSNCRVDSASFPKLYEVQREAFSGCQFAGDIYFERLEIGSERAFADCKVHDINLPDLRHNSHSGSLFAGTHGNICTFRSLDRFGAMFDGMGANKVILENGKLVYPCKANIDNLVMPKVEHVEATGSTVRGYTFENLRELNSEAFKDAGEINKLDMPSLVYAGSEAFAGTQIYELAAPSLESVSYDAFRGSTVYYLRTDKLSDIEENAFNGCFLGDAYLREVTEIGPYAFANCSILHLAIPKVETIREHAFENTDLHIGGDLIRTVGDYAFHSSDVEVSRDLSELVTIGDYAFCDAVLTTEIMGEDMKHIGDHAFENTQFVNSTGGELYDVDSLYMEYIGDYAFAGSNVTESCKILNGYTHIGDYAYYGCEQLTCTVSIEDGYVGKHAFTGTGIHTFNCRGTVELSEGCCEDAALQSVYLSDTEIIPARAFCNNEEMFTAELSAGYVGEEAFMDCVQLTVHTWEIPGVLDIADRAFKNTKLYSLDFAHVRSIGEEALVGSTFDTLESDVLQTIGNNAFGDNRFEKIRLTSLRNVGEGIFADYGLKDDEIVMGTLENVGAGAFAGNKFTFVASSGLVTMGERAFADCNISQFSAYNLSVIPDGAFSGNPVSEISIPNAVSIGDSAFEGAVFTELSCPLLETVGASAFAGVPLAVLDAPLLKSVGASAFAGTALTSFDAPQVTEIGDSAFAGCTSLETVSLNEAHIGTGVFAGCTSLDLLEVGTGLQLDAAGEGEKPTRVYDSQGVRHHSDFPAGSYRFFAEDDLFADRTFVIYSDGKPLGAPGDPLDESKMHYPWHEFRGWSVNGNIAELKHFDTVQFTYDEENLSSEFPHWPYYDCGLYYGFVSGQAVLYTSGHDYDEEIPAFLYEGVNKYPIEVVGYSVYREDPEFTKGMCLDNIQVIGMNAFYNCGWTGPVHFKALGEVSLIDDAAFCGSKGITEFTADDLNRFGITDGRYNVKEGVLFETEVWYHKPFHTLKNYPLGSPALEYVVPEGCQYIADYAFQSAPNLQKVVITSGVVEIGYRSFYHMEDIHEIVIADTVREIGINAFGDITFYDGDREMDYSEISGHRFVGDRNAMYLSDDPTTTKVVLDLNGKTADPPYDEYATKDSYGEISLPEDIPQVEGYEFIGWFTEPEGGVKVYNGDETSAYVLYAHWEPIVYGIHYHNLNGADNSANPTEYTIETPFTVNPLILEGSVFVGWTGTGFPEPTETIAVPEGTVGELAFTAHWDSPDVVIVLGDTVTPVVFQGKASIGPDGRIDLPDTDPTAEGYVFLGWYTEHEGGEKLSDGDKFHGDTIYAHWEAVVYSITYSGTDGAVNGNPGSYTVEDTVVLEYPVRQGYDFLGWTGTGLDGQVRDVTIETGSTGDRHYEAHMEMVEYIIVYTWLLGADNSANPTRYTVEDSFAIADPELEGYEFLGWTGTGLSEPTKGIRIDEGTTGNMHFRACWTPATYTITYLGVEDAVNDNPDSYRQADLPLTLNQPVREGYAFTGWDDGTSVSKDVTIQPGTAWDLTFRACWETAYHTVTVDAGEGKLELNGSPVDPVYVREYDHGTSITADGANLIVGDDVYTASDPDFPEVKWAVQDNLESVTCDLRAVSLYYDPEDTVFGVSIKTMPDKTEYLLEERFDPAGMTLQVTHRSGHTEVVDSGFTWDPEVFTVLGTQDVTVTYGGCSDECQVNVLDCVERLYVAEPPHKTFYTQGDWFDPTGMVVMTEYRSGAKDTVTDYTWHPEILEELGNVDVKIRHGDLTAYQPVLVMPDTDPHPDDKDRFVTIAVDYDGKVTEDAAAAAIRDIATAADHNPGQVIVVDAVSPFHESLLIPDSVVDSVREHGATLILTMKYGAVLLDSDVLSGDLTDGDVEASVIPEDGSGLPDGFIGDGRVYGVTVSLDGREYSGFGNPVGVSLRYPIAEDADPNGVRVYHLEEQEINTVNGSQSRLDRFVLFETDSFSSFAVKTADREYSATADIEGPGKVTVAPALAEEHVTVHVDVTPEEGYHVESVSVNGQELTLQDGSCTFSMPAADAAVKVVFAEDTEPVPVPGDGSGQSYVVWVAVVLVIAVIAAAAFFLLRKS